MDYISRKDAMTDAMCIGIACKECSFLIDPVNGGCKLEEFIRAIPAAYVVPRRKGKWIVVNHDGSWRVSACSACSKRVHYINYEPNYDFCPNCGADMRE